MLIFLSRPSCIIIVWKLMEIVVKIILLIWRIGSRQPWMKSLSCFWRIWGRRGISRRWTWRREKRIPIFQNTRKCTPTHRIKINYTREAKEKKTSMSKYKALPSTCIISTLWRRKSTPNTTRNPTRSKMPILTCTRNPLNVPQQAGSKTRKTSSRTR